MTNPSKASDLPRGLIDRKGTPAGKSTRLPSIRAPRDLTLGGVPKKVFIPNIPARRSKDEAASGATPKVETKKENRKGQHQRSERGQRRNRGQDNVVQSHSIFEQGPAKDCFPKGGYSYDGERSRGGGGGGGGGGGKISSIPKKESKTETKMMIDELMRDDFIDDGDDDDIDMAPVYLPLGTKIKKEIKKEEIKEEEAQIKIEPIDEQVKAVKEPAVPGVEFSAPFIQAEDSLKDLFSKCSNTDIGEIMFLQLPDTLPGVPPSSEEDQKPKIKLELGQVKREPNSEEHLSKNMNLCSLIDYSEGYAGKLQIRKSGKAQLVLGNVSLDVGCGTPCGFLQDLVSIHTQGSDGEMIVLGHINHRLICTPNFESLLKAS